MKRKSEHSIELTVGIPTGVTVHLPNVGMERLAIKSVNSKSIETAERGVLQMVGWIVNEIDPALFAQIRPIILP